MSLSESARTVRQRWSSAWAEVLCVTAAAVVSYAIVDRLFAHSYPAFASVIAIVCLAPGVPDHRRQAGALILGVAIGIGVGEAALLINDPVIRLASGLFLSMMIASSFGLGAVVPIQAGVSALLVVILGPEIAGYARLLDVLIGAVVGLAFNRVLAMRALRSPDA